MRGLCRSAKNVFGCVCVLGPAFRVCLLHLHDDGLCGPLEAEKTHRHHPHDEESSYEKNDQINSGYY